MRKLSGYISVAVNTTWMKSNLILLGLSRVSNKECVNVLEGDAAIHFPKLICGFRKILVNLS